MKSLSNRSFAGIFGTLCLVAVGCSGDTATPSNSGSANVRMVDGPTDLYSAVNVNTERVEITMTGATWVTVATPGRVINLLDLQDGVRASLATAVSLPVGHYTAMRLVLGADNSVTNLDGTMTSLVVPAGLEAGVRIPVSIDVTQGATTDIIIDFNATQSIQTASGGDSGQLVLRPALRAVDLAVTGSISGRLTDRATGAGLGTTLVSAQTIDASGQATIIRTATTHADGSYTLDLLPVGVSLYVVSQPTTASTAYTAQASASIVLPTAGSQVAFDAVFDAAQAGAISGHVASSMGSAQTDTIQLVQQLPAGTSTHALVVQTATLTIQAGVATYAFADVPVGAYTLQDLRTGDDGAGAVTSQIAQTTADATVVAGVVTTVDLGLPPL